MADLLGLPVETYEYFWGFFVMAALLLVVGAIAGMVAAKIVKRAASPVPAMAIDEAKKIRDTVSAPDGNLGVGAASQPPGRSERRRADAGPLARRRSATRWRPTAPSWRSPWRTCGARSTRLTDWRTHVEAHRREIVIGVAVVGFALGARMLRGRRRRRAAR